MPWAEASEASLGAREYLCVLVCERGRLPHTANTLRVLVWSFRPRMLYAIRFRCPGSRTPMLRMSLQGRTERERERGWMREGKSNESGLVNKRRGFSTQTLTDQESGKRVFLSKAMHTRHMDGSSRLITSLIRVLMT